MTGALRGMTTGKFVIDVLTRLSISRCAVWAQAQHRKVWRSIPHTVVVSVRTSIRRISAPHAKHFIAAPAPRSLNEALMVAKKVRRDCGGAIPLGFWREGGHGAAGPYSAPQSGSAPRSPVRN